VTVARPGVPEVPLSVVREAYERLLRVAPRRREGVARRRHARDAVLLSELLLLLPHVHSTTEFLAPPATRRVDPDTAVQLRAEPGRVVGRRWRIGAEIGRGGEGIVCEALDLRTRARVAVKFLRRSATRDERRIRREAATLRWLRLPGVVQILDDGVRAGVVWIVTELLDASPFPGPYARRSWSDVQPLALGLLEAIGRVHAAGVIHGDLKPSNVLVDAAGHVTLIDLGLAAARADRFMRPAPLGGGTPGYAAPECIDGAAPDVRGDLYSVGVILAEALSRGGARISHPAACRSLPAPARVRRAIARLMAPDPARRQASAAEVLVELDSGRRALRRRPWTRAELRARFQGPDRFLHLREDGARELHRLTRGDPAATEREITSWMRASLVGLEGGLVVVDRGALDRISGLGGPRRRADAAFAAALRRGRPPAVVRAALRQAAHEFDRGKAARALAALEEGAAAARRSGAVHGLRRVARRAVIAALNSGVGRDIDRALWLLQRGGEDDPELRALADVVRGASELQRGSAQAAWRIATRVTSDGPRAAIRPAWSVRELAARALSPRHRRTVVDEGARWARADGSREARTAYSTWRAWMLYLDGRCDEALQLHLAALARERNPGRRTRMALDAAVAALDSGRDDLAFDLARRAQTTAARLRRPVQEVRAWTIMRAVRYRRGESMPPDLEALQAVSRLGFREIEAGVRLREAAIAWRHGPPAAVRSILRPVLAGFDPGRASTVVLLAAALDAACGGHPSPARARAIARRAAAVMAPALAMQTLALLATGRPERRAELAASSRLRRPRGDSRDWARRREVLSLEESARILGAAAAE
jgi:hypothetical protein